MLEAASLPKVFDALFACVGFVMRNETTHKSVQLQCDNISVICSTSARGQSDVQFETYAVSSISRVVSALWIPVSEERHDSLSQAAFGSRKLGEPLVHLDSVCWINVIAFEVDNFGTNQLCLHSEKTTHVAPQNLCQSHVN